MSRMCRVIAGLSTVVFFCGMALFAAAQDARENETLSVPIGNITLKPPESVNATRNPVTFPHSRHFVYNCTECHHTWNFEAEFPSCKTSGCHDLASLPKKESGGAAVAGIRLFRQAYHQNCIGCHQAIKKQNAAVEKSARVSDKDLKLQKTGPTGCVECHPRD